MFVCEHQTKASCCLLFCRSSPVPPSCSLESQICFCVEVLENSTKTYTGMSAQMFPFLCTHTLQTKWPIAYAFDLYWLKTTRLTLTIRYCEKLILIFSKAANLWYIWYDCLCSFNTLCAYHLWQGSLVLLSEGGLLQAELDWPNSWSPGQRHTNEHKQRWA